MATKKKEEHIPAARTMAEQVEAFKADSGNDDRITRWGEVYFMGCHCGNFRTSSDEADVTRFIKEHMENCTEDEQE